jgi:hypothetical protein
MRTKRQFGSRGSYTYRSGQAYKSPITEAEQRRLAPTLEVLRREWKGKTVGMIGGSSGKAGVVLDIKAGIQGYYLVTMASVKWFEAGKKPKISDVKMRSLYDIKAYANHLLDEHNQVNRQAKLVDNYYDAL